MKWNVCIIVIVVFLSCKSSKQNQESKIKTESITEADVGLPERIAFLNLKIVTDSISRTNKIQVLNIKQVNGHLKNKDMGGVRSNNYLTCILYENLIATDTLRIEHPLYRMYEYMNEKNEMQVKEVKNNEAEFFIRFQLKQKTAQVKIIETLNGTITRELITFQL